MEYLYDEMPSAEKTTLEAHLELCAACRDKKLDLRGTAASLDQWTVQVPARHRFAVQWQPALKWAAAAALLVSTAFATGRMSRPEIDVAAIQAQVAKPIEEKLERQTQIAQLASERAMKEFQAGLSVKLREATEKAITESAAHTRKQFEQISLALATLREEDKKALASTLQALETQRASEYRSLRQDLERVALFSDESFRSAQRQLVQLASYPQPSQEN